MSYKPQRANDQWYAILFQNGRRIKAVPCTGHDAALAYCKRENLALIAQRAAERHKPSAISPAPDNSAPERTATPSRRNRPVRRQSNQGTADRPPTR